MAFDKIKYIDDYKRQNYETIRALIPKGSKEAVQNMAKQQGLSVSQLIVKALEAQYGLDLTK